MQTFARWKDEIERGLAYALEERLAPHYERHIVEECRYRTPDRVADRLARPVGARGPVVASRRVPRWLDIGAGTGLVGKAALRRGLRFDFIALDISEPMLKLIDCPSYVGRHRADATEAMPFADATFDGVLAAGVLEHLADPTPLFRNAARVMKPEGQFIFTFSPSRTGRAELDDPEEGLVSHDPGSIRACLTSCGLSPTDEMEYDAYLSGARGWVTHSLVGCIDQARANESPPRIW